MTGNKAYLSDYADYNGGFEAFGSDPKGGKTTCISNLLDAEIYEGLVTLGSKSGGWDQFGSPIATALICLSSNRGGLVPLLPAMLAGVAEDQGEGSANPAKPNPTSIDPVPLIGTNISKITRKPSKTSKHGHEKRKSTREAKDSKPKLKRSKTSSQGILLVIQAINHTWLRRKHKELLGFTLEALTKLAQARLKGAWDASKFLEVVKMDNPDITMEEYIQFEAEKTRRRGQEFNWETATYGKVRYFEDVDYFKDFENEFPAIVYKDTLTSELEVPSEPTISAHHAKKIRTIMINIELSLEDVLVESSDDVVDINVNTYSDAFGENIVRNHDTPHKSFTIMAQLPPRDQRHAWLTYEGQEYTDEIIQNFEERLRSDKSIFSAWVVGSITQLLNQSGASYIRFDGSVMGTSHASYERQRVGQRIGVGTNTSSVPHDQDQPNP
ncbi:hypothetical protein Tco_1556587 [Tanacetum coccineum]